MGPNTINEILESRKQKPSAPPRETTEDVDQFFSILIGEVVQEHFLEIRFRSGMRSCFSYSDLVWFNYDPDSGTLDLEFGVCLVSILGRGLGDRLFAGIKQKRVGWIKESDVQMQDHAGNAIFIQEINIVLPSNAEDEQSESKAAKE